MQRSFSYRSIVLPVFILLLGGFNSASRTFAGDAPAPSTTRPTAALKFHKILFLGNSITKHSPAPSIGWTGNWGMAATAEDKDYVHLVLSELAKSQDPAPEAMIENIASFERKSASYDVAVNLKKAIDFKADLIILAIGENVPALTTADAKAQFAESLKNLLHSFQADNHPLFVVRSNFWANKDKDQILKQANDEVGGIFVDISALGKDEANYARSEREIKHKGVANHPGDRGMQAIARAILDAMEKK